MFVSPVLAPFGAFGGVLTVSPEAEIVTVLLGDHPEIMVVVVAHLACALTLYVPAEAHWCDAPCAGSRGPTGKSEG